MNSWLTRSFLLIAVLILLTITVVSSSAIVAGGIPPPSVQQGESGPPKTDKDTVYKDDSGKTVTQKEFLELMRKGGFKATTVVRDGRIAEFQLVKLKPGETNGMPAGDFGKSKAKIAVGTRAPVFKGETLDGKNISLDDYKGKVLVMNFWFIACKPCVMEIPELNKIVAKYKGNPEIAFVSVAMDGKKEVTDFMKTHPFDYQIVPAARKILASFDVEMYPTHLIIGRDGLISYRTYGLGPNSIGNLEGGIRDAMRNMHPRQSTF